MDDRLDSATDGGHGDHESMISRVTALVLILCLVGGAPLSAQAPALRDLDGIDEFKERFNGDADVPRIVLLLSPT